MHHNTDIVELEAAEAAVFSMRSDDEESPQIDSTVELSVHTQPVDEFLMTADKNAKKVDAQEPTKSENNDWSQCTPSSLRTKISSPLKRKRVDKSTDLYELECKLVQEKHEISKKCRLKMRILR